MGRPIFLPPALPPAPPPAEPQSRNARLRDSVIGYLSVFALFAVLAVVIPEIPTGFLVFVSGLLGASLAGNIFNIRREEDARDRALRDRNGNGLEAERAEEVALEQDEEEIGPAAPLAREIRRRGSAPAVLSSQHMNQFR